MSARGWWVLGALLLLGTLALWVGPWADEGAQDLAGHTDSADTASRGARDAAEGAGVAADPTLAGVPREPAPRVPQPGEESAGTESRAEPGTLRLTGRVVDWSRRPVAGIVVQARGRTEARATTDAAGRYSVRLPRPTVVEYERVSLVARRAPDEVGVDDEVLWAQGPDPRDVGVLALGRGVGLEVQVRIEGRPVAGAEVLLLGWSSDAGGHLRARATTDAAGRAALPAVPEGAHRVVALAEGRGRAVALCDVPRTEAGPLVLDLPPERRLDLTLVFEGDEAPVVGATVEVLDPVGGPGWASTPTTYLPERRGTTTDAQGRASITGLAPEDSVLLRVTGGGVATAPEGGLAQRGHPRVKAGVTQERVLIPRVRRIRWPITGDEGPPPEDGEVLALRQASGAVVTGLPPTARMEAGHLVADGVGGGHVHAYATTTDGRIARLFAKDKESLGNPTSFRRVRRIDVLVRQEDGAVPEGLAIAARDQGNNPLGLPVPLDAQGRAALEGLHGGRVEVHLTTPDEVWGQQVLGTVDLDAGDGRIEASVARPRRGLLRVRIAGEPRLPGTYFLYAGSGRPTAIEEDAAQGEVRFAWRPSRPGGPGQLRLVAPGYLRADGRSGPFGSPATDEMAGTGAEPDVVEIDLVPGGTLVVRVAPPADGRATVGLEHWDEQAGAWVGHALDGRRPSAGLPAGGVERFTPLAPGRYRAIETATGVASDAVEIVRDAPAVEVALDLRHVGVVGGRVDVPAGWSFDDVRVRVEGLPSTRMNPASMAEGAGVSRADGRFGVRAPGGVPLTLVPVHPTLVPAPEGGRVTVRELRDDLVLRLVEGAMARVSFDPPPAAPSSPREFTPCRVLLFRERVEGAPAHECVGRLEGATLGFGGYAPGTYALWLDVPPHAPLAMGVRELGPGSTDLGRATLSTGASVQVRVLVPEGQSPPRLVVSVSREQAPAYSRFLNSRGEALVTLSGLAPGKQRLLVHPMMGAARVVSLDETIVVAGTEVIERTLDLR